MNNTRFLLVVIALVFMATVFAACSEPIEDSGQGGDSKSYTSSSAGPMNCVIVYSDHANSAVSASGLEEYVRGAKEANGYLGVVRLDGDPKVVYGEQLFNEHENEANIRRENDEYVAERMGELEGVRAEADEVDVLDALKLADDCLAQAEDDALDDVVVFAGTGLSTTGVVDFATSGLATLDLADYGSWVEESGQLPKLEHIDKIIWVGFDKVKDPQQEFPTDRFREKLEDFYAGLLKSSGVNEISFETLIDQDESGSDQGGQGSSELPSVSVVEMPPKPKYGAGDLAEVPADVLFNPDESTFLSGTDPKSNEQVIEIADSMKSGDLDVAITGYTAHYDTEKGCEELSLERANAMKDVLVEMGCPAERITTFGGGWGPYGEGSEEIDQKNRCVQFEFK